MLDVVAAIGAESIRVLWMPLTAWTLLWALSEGVLWSIRNAHPGIRYRLTQSVLWALPLCLVLAALLPRHWLPSSWALNTWAPPLPGEPASSVIVLAESVSAELVPLELATRLPTPLVGASDLNLWLVGLGLAACVVVATALVSLMHLGLQSVAVVQLRRALPRVPDPAFDATARQIASSLHVPSAEIALTTAEVVPMTLGIRRPLVVVPASLGPSDRRAALVHELVHVRERDPLAQVIEALVTALFSAHPSVHRLARRCDLLREMACDAAVLDHAGVGRRSYAALVSSFATPSPVRALPATVGMASPLFHIHHRLRAMSISRPLPSRLATWSPAFAVLLVAVLLVTAGTALAQTPQPIEEEIPVIVEEVALDSARVHALRTEIEALSAASGRLANEALIDEYEIPADEMARLIETENRLRTLQGDLEMIVESEHPVALRQLDEEAQALRAQAEVLAATNGVVSQLRTDTDSARVEVFNQLQRMTEDGVQLQTLMRELETVRAAHARTSRASGIVEEEIPLEAVRTSAISLGDVYPNPAQDVVVINVTVEAASDVTVGLYDLTGRQLVTRSLRLQPGAHKVEIDTSDLAAGTYVYRTTVSSGGQKAQSSHRVTIVR